MTAQTEQELRARARAIILQLAPAAGAPDSPDAHLIEDLAYHSLALFELAFALEDELNIPPIEQAAAATIRTVGDLEDHIVRVVREAEAIKGVA